MGVPLTDPGRPELEHPANSRGTGLERALSGSRAKHRSHGRPLRPIAAAISVTTLVAGRTRTPPHRPRDPEARGHLRLEE
ncbi:hypothetical protein GCM10017778_61810 [Streptomyces vinaceus]|nr:hypothetical protein GCM10017778_61810 [Streptomyces vinaceus]